ALRAKADKATAGNLRARSRAKGGLPTVAHGPWQRERRLERTAGRGGYSGLGRARQIALSVWLLALPARSQAVDLTRGLRVESVVTGWYEASSAEGRIKLVPAA